jgi:5-methyltetrahydrofolate--homocysteine methyltransferase
MDSEIKKRYNAFWAHDYDERAVLYIDVPTQASYMKPPEDATERYENISHRIEAFKRYMRNTQYFAEGFPYIMAYFGPGVMAAMLGSDYTYSHDTVWFGKKPLVQDWRDMDSVRLSPENRMYKMILDMNRRLCRESNGSFTVSMTDLGGNLDILASLRGTEQLLMDLVEAPEELEKALVKIDGFWETAYSHFHTAAESPAHGTATWMSIWCPGTWYPLQCDFSAMISPDHFERFVMPSLTRAANFLDHCIYHLDGQGELPHLDMLLSMDRLDGIQWVPGSGKPRDADDCWFPIYEKIQSRGKCLVLTEENSVADALYLLKHLSHKGLFIRCTLNSAEEAEEVVRKAKEYAK